MSEKKTPWFPGDVLPTRPGVYEREIRTWRIAYSMWTGKEWKFSQDTPDRAESETKPSYRKHLPWRGLAQEPK